MRVGIGLTYAKFHFRRIRDPVVRFTDSVSRSKRALVVLPESPRDLASLQWVLRYLSDRFSSGDLVVVARNELITWLRDDKRYEVIGYREEDVNWWFVPRNELLRKVKKGTFDIALDLNVDFTLPGAFICRASSAPVRVSFVKDHADEFYNLLVQTKAVTSLTHAYRSFLRCMEMF